jgi:hypothetical protein
MCKNLDIPHPLTPSPIFGRRGTRIIYVSPLPIFGRGAGGEGKDLILHSDAPLRELLHQFFIHNNMQKCHIVFQQITAVLY